MGKRKLNGTNFFQCEWTGFPMKTAYCYMPAWSPGGKLLKKGSYCNWEAVVAHAAYLLNKTELTPEEHLKIMEHIEFVTGTVVTSAPHYEELLHTKGRMDATAYHQTCSRQTNPITGVKISPEGEVFEVIIEPKPAGQESYNFEWYLHSPFNREIGLSTFHSMRKKGASKGTDRDLSVWYYATKDLPHNATASNLFKMQLYGDILLVQQSREASFLPRERYVSFNKSQFDEQFTKKRKRAAAEPPSMTPAAYAEHKKMMQETLNSYEQKVSQTAVPPKQMSRAVTTAPSAAPNLAKKLKDRGILPPEQKTAPSVPPPQASAWVGA
jgi:hypothetical protein